jgi:HAMP domain-containing protein
MIPDDYGLALAAIAALPWTIVAALFVFGGRTLYIASRRIR